MRALLSFIKTYKRIIKSVPLFQYTGHHQEYVLDPISAAWKQGLDGSHIIHLHICQNNLSREVAMMVVHATSYKDEHEVTTNGSVTRSLRLEKNRDLLVSGESEASLAHSGTMSVST